MVQQALMPQVTFSVPEGHVVQVMVKLLILCIGGSTKDLGRCGSAPVVEGELFLLPLAQRFTPPSQANPFLR